MKPYDARALTAVPLWQEMEGKSERAYTGDLEQDSDHLKPPGLKHAPHRTILYRTRQNLTDGYMRLLNRKVRMRDFNQT